jgi:hypothetical protein
MTTAAESAAPAKIVRILNFMIFPQMVWRFRVLSGAHYLQAGCADSQNPLMHPWAKPLPVYPDQRTSADWPGMSEKCHVWTAPGWQELFSRFAALVGAAMCSAF